MDKPKPPEMGFRCCHIKVQAAEHGNPCILYPIAPGKDGGHGGNAGLGEVNEQHIIETEWSWALELELELELLKSSTGSVGFGLYIRIRQYIYASTYICRPKIGGGYLCVCPSVRVCVCVCFKDLRALISWGFNYNSTTMQIQPATTTTTTSTSTSTRLGLLN